MVLKLFIALFIAVASVCAKEQIPCTQRLAFEEDSFVCVCNSSGCDSFGQVSLPEDGYYHHTASSRDEFRFSQKYSPLTLNGRVISQAKTIVYVNTTDIKQRMYGFGSSFTDAAGLNIASLSQNRQEDLLRGYFSPDGLEYNMGRIPIAGCDFSTRPYSYDEVEGDEDLIYFNLTMEDYDYKLPHIKQAIAMNNRQMLLFGSPWSPPSWMKTNGMINGSGSLLPQYDQAWANYFIRFVESYENEGVNLWGLTVQNEPTSAYMDIEFPANECGYTAEEERGFIRDFLGPTLNASKFNHLKLMAVDDQRAALPWYPAKILEDVDASQFVDGIGVHWYLDQKVSPEVVDTFHEQFPDKFILYTEASFGVTGSVLPVRLGSWERAENYAHDIIENINHWASGWVDWNMALDMAGGPNWADIYLDSPIIINKEKDEFYRQPMYYALGHFSKFISEGYRALSTSVKARESKDESIEAAAVTDPAMRFIVLIALNRQENDELVTVADDFGNQFDVLLPTKSINTIVFKRQDSFGRS